MTRHSHEALFVAAGGRPRPAASVGELARAAARRGGQRPFLTFYDDATGERTELGHATLDNWVSKAANLLAGDLDLDPGAALAVGLPTHWTTVVILLAAWRAGVRVVLGDGTGAGEAVPAGARAVPESALASTGPAPRTIAVGSGFGGRLAGDPGDALGFAEEVLGCPDEFDDPPVEASAPALDVAATSASHGDLLDLASAVSEALGLTAGARVLSTLPLEAPEGVLTVLAALAADASVVLVAGGEGGAQEERAASERCDLLVTAGEAAAPPPGGVPRWWLEVAWEGDRPVGVRASTGRVAS